MTEIVTNEGSETEVGDEIAFNNLTFFRFYDLPSLTAFHLGNHTIKFPSLVQVDMHDCPNTTRKNVYCNEKNHYNNIRIIAIVDTRCNKI